MAEAFGGYVIGQDSHRGPYIDNTAVALVAMAWLRAGSR